VIEALRHHKLLLACVLLGPLFWVVAAAVAPWLLTATSQSRSFNWWFLLWIVVLAPVLEELCFRGFIQESVLAKSWGRLSWVGVSSANAVTSVLFVVMHLFGQESLWAIAVMVPSVLFGAVRERYNHVLPSICLHSFYNSGFLLCSNLLH